MELKDIKAINQRIYELDDKISRESKVIFISTLVFILTKNFSYHFFAQPKFGPLSNYPK